MSDIERLDGTPRITNSPGQFQKDSETGSRPKPKPRRQSQVTDGESVDESEKAPHQIDDLA
jgi:hypothetical protein